MICSCRFNRFVSLPSQREQQSKFKYLTHEWASSFLKMHLTIDVQKRPFSFQTIFYIHLIRYKRDIISCVLYSAVTTLWTGHLIRAGHLQKNTNEMVVWIDVFYFRKFIYSIKIFNGFIREISLLGRRTASAKICIFIVYKDPSSQRRHMSEAFVGAHQT